VLIECTQGETSIDQNLLESMSLTIVELLDGETEA
jgi:hypothetical protein